MSLTLIIMIVIVAGVVLQIVWTLAETAYELWNDWQKK